MADDESLQTNGDHRVSCEEWPERPEEGSTMRKRERKMQVGEVSLRATEPGQD